jgi:transposase
VARAFAAFFHGLGRLWTYVRDERGVAGCRPPAVLFFYSPD